MNLTFHLTLFICLTLCIVGLLLIFAPQTARRLERLLNRPLSQREILAIRLGFSGEQRLEQTLNQNVLGTRITWDNWIHQRPRLIGFLLCAAATLLWLM
jgi:uncharacterized protein YjeT (DUF2065 family)